MANFTLNWTPQINSNVIAQRAGYRGRIVGGAFITTGFVPANDLSTTANTASIAGLSDNIVYQFIVNNLCTVGGEVPSSIYEQINFACISPVLSTAGASVTASVAGLPVDISKVSFTLYDSTGTTVIQGPVVINTSGGTAQTQFLSLAYDTIYVVKTQLYATVNGVEIVSGCIDNNSAAISTGVEPTCPAPTNLTVTAS